MCPLHVATLSIVLRARVPRSMLLEHFPASPYKLGENIARIAHDYAIAQQLGYYPALEFLQSQNVAPPFLMHAVAQVAEFSTRFVDETATNKLLPIFSSVRLASAHPNAYALPSVRPSQPNALSQLARHYTPDNIKGELLLTLIQKQKAEDGLDRYARSTVERWLADEFDEFEIKSALVV